MQNSVLTLFSSFLPTVLQKQLKRLTVMLIDVRRRMFDSFVANKSGETTCMFRVAMECAHAFQLVRLRNQDHQPVSVVFLGTGQSQGGNGLDNIYVLQS